MSAIEAIDLAAKFAAIEECWSPRIVAEVNDSEVKLARLHGEFIMHHHEREDELFFVVRGVLRIRLADGEIVLQPGQMAVIPRGVEHQPVAEEEVWVMLFEPRGTLNTGNVRNERTVEQPARL